MNTASAIISSTPTASPQNIQATTNSSHVTLTWAALISSPENGYTQITDYKVLWNGGGSSNTYTTKVSSTSNTTQAIIPLGTLGLNYRFRIIAVNLHGDGPASPFIDVLFAIAPGQMDPPIIQMQTLRRRALHDQLRNVVITWTAPNDTNGAPILEYEIQILNQTSGLY